MNLRRDALWNNEIAFHGSSLSPGIACGKAYQLKRVDLQLIENNKRIVTVVSYELAKIDFAVKRSAAGITRLMNNDLYGTKDATYQILEAELRILNDPESVLSVKTTIEHTSMNGESVLAEKITLFRNEAFECTDPLTIKRLVTLQDLYYRLLYNMLFSEEDRMSAIMKISAGSILVADRLIPVEVAVMPKDKVAGILIEEGTANSHASLMAQTLGVPVIIDFPGIGSLIDESTEILIDAYRGNVFLNPTAATLKECNDRELRHKSSIQPVKHTGDASIVHCADRTEIRLQSNASNRGDIQHAHNQRIREIGLFRSEIQYLAGTVLPTEIQEAAYFKGILSVEGMRSMTIRLLDMGGDKLPVYIQMEKETDPQLGCRGIRFLLTHPDLMKKQIRAILTARTTSNIRLLLPFITTADDLSMAREIIEEVYKEMKLTDNYPHVGIMVEVPSVAYSIERFLPKVDFVCLGTNDLLQYFFAVNREQAEIQKYNRFTHPAFFKFVSEVIKTCGNHGKHLTVCGDMASDPAGCCLLAAAGATIVSVQPVAIAGIRSALLKCNVGALQKLLPGMYNSESADEVEHTFAEFSGN
jgi:phosphoenolpyruvate-protein phosphotransferase